MTPLLTQLEKDLEICEKATKGPYHVECVHHDEDIAYEVSIPPEGFHVAFYQSNCMDHGVTAKSQANFYAHARTRMPQLVEALKVAVEVLEQYDKVQLMRYPTLSNALQQITRILEKPNE